MPTRWHVDEGAAGLRLDAAVAAHLRIGLREARRLVDRHLVRLGGKRGWKGMHVVAGDEIAIDDRVVIEDGVARRAPVPQPELPLAVLYEDEHLVALDKPAGAATHPLGPGERDTLANALIARYPECADASDQPRECGVAHRLDLHTTGVLLAARTRAAWGELRRAFSAGEVDKTYWALVQGTPPPAMEIDAPLATRKGAARVVEDGLAARTEARVLVADYGVALVEARALTGRLHQIRAHLAHTGHPLVGDELYGARTLPGVPREQPILHARAIELVHPVFGRRVRIAAPLSPARLALCENLLRRPLPELGQGPIRPRAPR